MKPGDLVEFRKWGSGTSRWHTYIGMVLETPIIFNHEHWCTILHNGEVRKEMVTPHWYVLSNDLG